jgi:hypothetical protein
MATSPKGFTQVAGTDAPNGPDQINAAELFVENLIGESKPTASALPTSGNWVGRTVWVVDENNFRVCTALPGTWTPVLAKATNYDLTYQTIYSAGTPAPTLTTRNGRAWLDGQIISTSASFGAGGAGFTAATFPSSVAPATNRTFVSTANSILAVVTITSSGSIVFIVSQAFTGPLSLNLGDISWALS